MFRNLRTLLILVICFSLIFGMTSALFAQQKVKISYYFYGNPGEKEAEEAAIKAFIQAYPNIEVEAIHIPTNYEEKIRTMVAGGTPPDVMVWNPEHVPFLYKALLPLDNLIKTDLNKDIYTYPDNFLKAGSYRGHYYLLPKRFDGIGVMVYNEKLFKDNGLPFPSEPYPRKLSVQEFATLASKIAKDVNGDGVNDIYGSDPLYYGIVFPWFRVINEGLGANYKTPQWNKPPVTDALKFIYRGEVVEKWALPWGENRMQWFFLGKLGMVTDFGMYLMPEMRKITDFGWDIAARPGKEAPLPKPGGVAICKDTKNREAAWTLAKFLSTDIRAQRAYMSAFGMGVTKKSAEEFLKQEHPKYLSYMAKPVGSIPKVAIVEPPHRFSEMMNTLWREKEAFYAGKIGAEEFGNRIQQIFSQMLEEEKEMFGK